MSEENQKTTPANNTQPSPRMRRIVGAILIGFICVLIGASAVLVAQESQEGGTSITKHTTVANDGNTITSPEEQTIDTVIAKASPSVVSVLTTITVNNYKFLMEEIDHGFYFRQRT